MIVHFLPFIVFMSVSIPAFFHGSDSRMVILLTGHSVLFNGLIWTALLVQYSVYLFQIVKLTHKYRSKAEQELSNIEYVDISWLKTFLYAFLVVFALLAIMFAGALHNLSIEWMNQAVSLVFSVTIFVLGYKGMFQQSIFSNADPVEIPPSIPSEAIKPRPIDENLSRNLLEYMEAHKPHRDPELTLTSLAKQVNMGRNQLSEIINNSVGCNFYDFVNKYRVEDVKQLFINSKFKDFTILAIAYEAGFPSKSTFNSIFKKFTGLTPSEYRNSLL